jgi:hypothetical protein
MLLHAYIMKTDSLRNELIHLALFRHLSKTGNHITEGNSLTDSHLNWKTNILTKMSKLCWI